MVLQTYGLNVNNDDEGDNCLSRVSEDHVKRGNSSSSHLVAMSPFPGDYAPVTNHYYTDLDAVNYLSQGNKLFKRTDVLSLQMLLIFILRRIHFKQRTTLIEQLFNC